MMMLRIILAALAVASVNAQTAGNSCGQGASLNPVTNKCECPAGKNGHPDLCCHGASKKSCYVAGDPVLSSFTGSKIGLDFPCGTLISSSSKGACQAKVFGAADEQKLGVFYTTKVTVLIKRNSVQMVIVISDNQAKIYKNAKVTVHEISDGPRDLKLQGVRVGGLSSSQGMFIVDPCGTEIVVRLPNGDSAEQARAPGICIKEPLDRTIQTSSCSVDTDFTGKTVNQYLNKAIQPMDSYFSNAGNLKASTTPGHDLSCGEFQTIAKNKCGSTDRRKAFKKCAFVLFHPTVRRCFAEHNRGQLMKIFNQCVKTYCTGEKSDCDNLQAGERIQACAPSLMGCKSWDVYRRKHSSVAGEASEEEGYGEAAGGGTGGDEGGVGGGESALPGGDEILADTGDQEAGGEGGVGGGFNPPSL